MKLYIPGFEPIVPPRLSIGSHEPGSNELCAMEMVAFLAGEEHTDSPECVCPIIATVVKDANDGMFDDDQRQKFLLPRIWNFMGTSSREDFKVNRASRTIEQERALMLIDWIVRTALPQCLNKHPFRNWRIRRAISNLPPIIDEMTATSALATLRSVRSNDHISTDIQHSALEALINIINHEPYSAVKRAVACAKWTEQWDSFFKVIDRMTALTPAPKRNVVPARVEMLAKQAEQENV